MRRAQRRPWGLNSSKLQAAGKTPSCVLFSGNASPWKGLRLLVTMSLLDPAVFGPERENEGASAGEILPRFRNSEREAKATGHEGNRLCRSNSTRRPSRIRPRRNRSTN